MSTLDDFASRIGTIEELPGPFGPALRERVRPQEAVQLLIYSPPFVTPGGTIPATVLAVVERRWLMASEGEAGRVTVTESGFDDTLLLELTSVLLHGQLKIDFVDGGAARSAAVEFNTVMMKDYRAAVGLMLGGMEGRPITTEADADASALFAQPLFAQWPYKFRNLSPEYLPQGRRARAAVYWPTVYGGFNREIAPAAALLLSESEVVLFSEEKAPWWYRTRQELKLGDIVTYFPLHRLARFHLSQNDRFGVLSLEVHAYHGGEKLEVLFALEQAEAVSRLMEQAMEQATTPAA